MFELVFNENFRSYVEEKKLQHRDCQRNGNWSGCIFWSPDYDDTRIDWRTIRNKIEVTSKKLNFPSSCLIQFWCYLPENDREWFITEDQPFIISAPEGRETICDELCSYQVNISEKRYCHGKDEEDISVVARVFRNQKMEFTPDVCYYSNEEYPPRLHVSPFYVKGSVAIPLVDSLGVIEIVWMRKPDDHFWNKDLPHFVSGFQECGLICPGWCTNLCGQYDDKDTSLCNDLSEVNEVLKVVGRTYDLNLAQTWILCKHCSFLLTPQRVDYKFRAHYINRSSCHTDFLHAQSLCSLQKGKGVIGNAISYPNLVFCNDVAKLNVSEYPLAHFAHRYDLSACLAVCLTSDHTGLVYVLELFLPSSYLKGEGPVATLVPILEDIKKRFPSFKVASGEENVSFRVIDAISPQGKTLEFGTPPLTDSNEKIRVNSIDCGESSVSTIGLGNIVEDSGVEYMDTLNTLDIVGEVRRLHHSKQGLSKEKRTIGVSKKSTDSSRETTRGKGIIPIPLEELEKHFGKPREVAANDLQVSVSTLKRRCRDLGLLRWPNKRKVSRVTVKAKYEDNKFIQFKLPKASGVDKLHEQVSKRLKLDDGSYTVQYQESDGDLIPVTCDDDLRKHILNSKGLKDIALKISIVQAAENPK